MTKNLHDLAIEAGMTDLEYVNEMYRIYHTLLSAAMGNNELETFVYTVNFTDHDLEITARRIPAKNVSVN